MSLKKVHDDQPKEFKFSVENLKKAEEILNIYPKKNRKSAVMPFLYLAQKQNDNWIPISCNEIYSKLFIYALYFRLRSSYILFNV